VTATTVLILGGTSDVGLAAARVYASKGWRVVLAGRDGAELDRNVQDIRTRYGGEACHFRLNVLEADGCFEDPLDRLPDTAICVVGLLGSQERGEQDAAHAKEIIRTNFEGLVLLFEDLARRMVQRGSGTLVGVGSVAGDRGRASNYIYGAAKAGFSTFLSGLRNRLSNTGVRIVTVKPGFIRTRMTVGLELPNWLTATAEEVGLAIYRAAEVTKADVVYVRPVWALIMAVIRNIPESIFKRMKL
jgi:decaprenylphospho-beta-D-erythro-pentofuranosid-2-ulose 2-reductase